MASRWKRWALLLSRCTSHLHAAQHGVLAPKPLEDMERGLSELPDETWTGAALLATEVDAIPAFASGLRLTSSGAVLAERFGLPQTHTVELLLAARSSLSGAGSLQRVAIIRGLGAKTSFVRAKLVPSPEYMRFWSPLADRGRLGIALAYLWRLLWVVVRAPRAAYVWLAVRRDVRRSSQRPKI